MNSPEFWSEYLQLSVALLSDAVTVELLCTNVQALFALTFCPSRERNKKTAFF